MADEYFEVEETGLGGNITGSLGGALAGILMFIISFPVLWWNEGGVNLSKVAQTSALVDAQKKSPENQGKLVSLTGTLKGSKKISDPDFLKEGDFFHLDRKVEMFSWVEEKETKEEKKLGGGTRKVTKYTYKKVWTSTPLPSKEFKIPGGHENPLLTIKKMSYTAPEAEMGLYKIDLARLSLPPAKKMDLKAENLAPGKDDFKLDSGFLFKGKGTLNSPLIGDIRIGFYGLQNGLKVTIFGKMDGEKITPYIYKGYTLFRAFASSRDEAIQTMASEHKMLLWLFRIVGFVLMWLGMSLVFEPLFALMDILPFLGSLGRGIVMAITFGVALILSLLTILISIIFHNIIALIITVILVVAGVYFWAQNKKAAGSPTAQRALPEE